MILSMLKIQHVEQYSMLKSQYSMLKAKGIQHVERNTACWKREVSRWNEFITCRNELTACPLLTFKYPACARQVHLPVHAQQAQQWSLKKAPVKECSWSLKNAPVQECSYSLKNAPGPWRMLLVECSCVCASSAPPCACATGTAVVLEECSCERMLLVLEECSRHSSGPWRMLKMSPRNPRNASWGISRQPVAGFTSALCLCRELAQGYWAQPSAERQVMSAPNISSWMQLLPWVARFFLPRLPAEFCRLRSSSWKECVASEQLGYVLGDCSALRPAQKGAWLLTNHRKPRTSTTSPAPRGKVQTHMSIGDSNAGMGFDHPVTGSSLSKVLLGPNSVVDRRRRRSCWARTRSSTDASCRRTAHRGCRARAPAFTDRISVQQKFTHRSAAQSVLLACLCARASVNFPPAQIHRSLTSATLRFCNDGVDSANRSRAQRSCRPTHNPSSCFRTFEDFKLFFSPGPWFKWNEFTKCKFNMLYLWTAFNMLYYIQHAVFVDSIQHAIIVHCIEHAVFVKCTCEHAMHIQHAVFNQWCHAFNMLYWWNEFNMLYLCTAFNMLYLLNMLCSMQNIRWTCYVQCKTDEYTMLKWWWWTWI